MAVPGHEGISNQLLSVNIMIKKNRRKSSGNGGPGVEAGLTFGRAGQKLSVMTDQDDPTARLEQARALARSFRRYLPEGDQRLFDQVLAKAGPFIRTAVDDPHLDPRDAFLLSLLTMTLRMVGELSDQVEELRRDRA
jgi:hypothetical protein